MHDALNEARDQLDKLEKALTNALAAVSSAGKDLSRMWELRRVLIMFATDEEYDKINNRLAEAWAAGTKDDPGEDE